MINKLIQQAKKLPCPKAFFIDCTHGYDFDLPDNILFFSRGGIAPVNRNGAIHHRYLLNLNLGAPCHLIVNGHRFLMNELDCFLIYPYENHLFIHSEAQIFRLMITFEMKNKDILPEAHSLIAQTSETAEITLRLLTLYCQKDASRWELTLLLTMLLEKLKQASNPLKMPDLLQDSGSSLTAKVVKYILSNLRSELNSDKLASVFHVSTSSIRRHFLTDTGICLGKYIRHSRIMKAMYYLRKNEKNISEIAEACGYHSIQAFSRAFKAEVGMTPLTYRLSPFEKKSNNTKWFRSHP